MSPYADPQQRREYDQARKQKQRSQGWTKKGVDNRLTALEIKNAQDLCSIINEVVDEAATPMAMLRALEYRGTWV
jgi:hypothetical protein